jgi:hypothetical protein
VRPEARADADIGYTPILGLAAIFRRIPAGGGCENGRDPLTWRRAAMAKVEANISMSLDGFVTGPNLNRYRGLGEGGEILHAWTDESRSVDLAMGEERQIAGVGHHQPEGV